MFTGLRDVYIVRPMQHDEVSRNAVARELEVHAAQLLRWERSGVIPGWGSVPVRAYMNRVQLIQAARTRLSMQAVREALALGGS